jgi:cation diffusion facilitator family transporter
VNALDFEAVNSASSQASKTRAVMVAFFGGLVVFGVKLLGYALTGSVGVLSDALESVVNIAAAALAAWAVSLAARPPDEDHPYGHDKAEYLSSVLEGVLVGMAAVLIVVAARERLLDPRALPLSVPGLLVTALSGLLNFWLARYLIGVGRAARSIALEADGRHVMADVVTSIGVLLGVLVASLTGLTWLDPLIAILVAVNVLKTGYDLIRHSLRGLMDEALSSDELASIHAVLESFKVRYLEVHDLRTRSSGVRRFVDFHLIVSSELSVQAAHDLCDEIENAISLRLSDASVTIHVEPPEFRLGDLEPSRATVRF